jgi:hypothetical protein
MDGRTTSTACSPSSPSTSGHVGDRDPPSNDRRTRRASDSRSREYLSQFTRAQIDSVAARLVPPLQTPEAATQLRKITDILRNERFDTVRVIGAQTNTVNGIRHVNLTYELHSPFSWFLANVATL